MYLPSMQLRVEDPLSVVVCAFITRFPAALAELEAPHAAALLQAEAWPELNSADDSVRAAIRDALRQRGFKPTGRSKPSSEYLLRARGDASLRSINAAVDVCNAVSLHSGLPISVVDLDLLRPPLSIRTGRAGESYVFNPTGHTIEIAGLPCLCDAEGPTANAVKDAQRTKTSPSTRATLTILWSRQELQARTDAALAAYRGLLSGLGAELDPVQVELQR
jgi:DNA/RNA-binding domain of Phe-tRNA-synthetase-like protein